MHDDRELVEERITRELSERVLPLVHPQRRPLTVEGGPSLDALAPVALGERWGPPWGTTWFRFTGEVPASWSGRRVEALIDLGFRLDAPGFQCEGLVRDGKGRPVQGIHPRRQAVALGREAGPVELTVEAASNPTFPQFRPSPFGSPSTAGDRPLYRLDRAELVLVDPDAEALVHDLDVLDGVMRTLAADDPRRARIRVAVVAALDLLARPGSEAPTAAARAVLADVLRPQPGAAHRVIATGHAHIDTAWLWPLAETARKCTRTFASAVALMDAEPEYRFSCSQAQQYAWVAEREPELFARITAKVAEGQWIPVGGMWVEPDMNLPSGESIVRQIVHGQRFFESHFGRRCREVWIPDVFGYPAGLPQVFAAGGMTRFVTQKLSWNRTNRFPHSTFWWEGLDGTRVLTHFPPVDTYNAEITPTEIAYSVRRFAEHEWSGVSLMPFGYGDGGGGPTREMLERMRRVSGIAGMPDVAQGSPDEFFDAVDAEVARGAPVPVWRGELYFETHRGTLTSQLRTKLGNRRCERLLREAELWMTLAGDGDPHELDALWQEVLTQQFHDIIPGSSIAWVHADAEAAHTRVAAVLEDRIAATLRRIAPAGPVLVNVATGPRDEVVVADVVPEGDGPTQALADGRTAFRARVPGLGLAAATAEPTDERVVVTDRTMANGRLAVAWDLDGNLRSVIDVTRARELLPAGALAAVLELAPDRPVRYDAWDLESWVRDDPERLTAADTVEVVERGPLVGAVRVRRVFGPSSATLTYVMRAASSRLDVVVELDWHHREHLLSLAFPLDVRADAASCGVQFGSVRRPTHPSTSWDAAKFEVCAHRYVDVAEPSFGVAVLNDGRYGHALFGGAVRVSLARAASYPDPLPDQGRHVVTVSLFPHGAGLADVVAEAERLDLPLGVFAGGSASGLPPRVVDVTGTGVEVDAVKLADDGSGDVVVRLHEACGDRARVTVASDRRIVAASRCNLLEEPDTAFEVSDGIVAAILRPFELLTLRLTR